MSGVAAAPPPFLKPCPFCGSDQLFKPSPEHSDVWVECASCRTSGPSADSPEIAITAWNTRP